MPRASAACTSIQYGLTVWHLYDDRGNHQLQVDDRFSSWAPYQVPVEFENYMAFTDYYRERVIKFIRLDPLGEPTKL